MRHLILIAALVMASPVFSAPAAGQFDAEKFKQRFKAADQNRDGKLSREEAYAAFPRMPEFFDEIDSNRDNHITLAEVNRAMEKRVAQAMATNRYGNQLNAPSQALQRSPASSDQTVFASRSEARRAYRSNYYESLAEERRNDQLRGEPVPSLEAPAQINKAF